MQAILAIFLCLFLSGCFLDPKQDLASCQFTNTTLAKPSDPDAAAEATFVLSNRIELCMADRGYEIMPQAAPECSNDLGTDLTKEAPHKLRQATSARCYAPKGWIMQQVLAFERQIGQLQ
jgi:hypothetical protein